MGRRRVFRALVVVAMVVTAGITEAGPARAVTSATVTFTGALVVGCAGAGGGLGFQVPPVPARNCTFGFAATTACTDTIANALKGAKPPTVMGTTCSVLFGGTLTGWCDNWVGSGGGNFIDSTGNGITINNLILRNGPPPLPTLKASAGLSKGVQKGIMDATGTVTNPTPLLFPAGGSCLVNTATTFLVTVTATMSLS